MEVDTSRQTKRKRSPEPFALKKRKVYMVDGPAIEQNSNGANGGGGGGGGDKEMARSEARKIYEAFDVLCGASGAAHNERRRACVDLIFNAASGTLLAKRLAARLIPRFMREFPDKIPKAVECLLDVIVASRVGNQQQQQQQQHRMIWEGLRRDALEGLGNTCDLIVKNVQRPEQLLGKVVHCLLRQLIQPRFPPHCGSMPNGSSSHADEVKLVIASVEKAFRSAPQEVIAECLHSWRDGDAASAAGATIIFENLLLADRSGLSEAGYSAGRFGQSNGNSSCLAVDVLSRNPDTIRWLMEATYGIMQGVGPARRGQLAQLNALMQKLSPYYQKQFSKGNELQHRGGQAAPRHGTLGPPPSVHPPHLQPHIPKSDGARVPGRPPHDLMFASQWQNENAHYLSSHSLPLHDNGPCLWFAAMPNGVRKEHLGCICAQYGTVNSIVFPPAPCHDKALVVFGTPREASTCCHHILSNPALSGGRHICATVPGAGNPCHPRDQISTCIWVGGVPSPARERDILNALRSANIPLPRHLIVVKGVCPGYLLELQFLSMVTQALDCLQSLDNQCYEGNAAHVVNPPQLDLHCRPPHPRSQGEGWKLGRSEPTPCLPPGNWGSQRVNAGTRASRPYSHPPPPRPPPFYPRNMPASSSTLRPPPLPPSTDGSRGAWAERSSGVANKHHEMKWDGQLRMVQSPPRQPSWSGSLAKSGETLCKLVCWDQPNMHRWGAASQEPKEWPNVLDVRLRVDLNIALKPEGERSLLHLSAGNDTSDREGLMRFIQYLTDRTRAGVVQLKGSSGDRSGDRTLYLIPPTESAAKALGVEVGARDSLIVLAVPYTGRARRQHVV